MLSFRHDADERDNNVPLMAEGLCVDHRIREVAEMLRAQVTIFNCVTELAPRFVPLPMSLEDE